MTTPTESMLVRTPGGAWERLQPQTTLPDGGLVDLFGEDVGPVLGRSAPLAVVAASPRLATGAPDAICVDAEGNVAVLALALSGAPETTLPALLSHAGALHGMSFEAFAGLCDRTAGAKGGLAGFVQERCPHPEFHAGTFEVTVSDALAQGRFQLVAIVATAPPQLVQSMRYLNASGGSVACYEARSYASESVLAVQARAVDVGLVQRTAALHMTAAGMYAITERTSGPKVGAIVGQLQKSLGTLFDEVAYAGDSLNASLAASLVIGDQVVELVTADSSGALTVAFEALAPVDAHWTSRAELCQAMNRLLGTDLGDVRDVSRLDLTVSEHLMDATLMEAFVEVLADTVQTLREPNALATA